MSIGTINIFMTRNQDNRLIYLMNKIAFSYLASWLQWLQFWLIHEISSKWASPFSFRNTWMFWVKSKHDNYSLSYCYEGFVIVIKLLLYLLDFEIEKKTEFQCLLRLEVDIDFNHNTTYSSEKEATTFLWWHTGIWLQIVSVHYADEK